MNLAPNGKPSNLTAQQYKLVRTTAFKNWFGDWENNPSEASKVVDENGEPLVLYRGNLVNQEELGHTFNLGQNFLKKQNSNQFGFFFTNEIDIAKKYMLVDHFDEIRGGSITSVFMKSKKILDLLDFDLKIGQHNFVQGLIKKGINFNNGYNYLESKILDSYPPDNYKYWGYNVFDYFDVFPELRNLFIENGFNSVVFYEMSRTYSKYKVYVAFDSNQIKLADGSNTTFDSNNNDIRFDEGGGVDDNEELKNALIQLENYKSVYIGNAIFQKMKPEWGKKYIYEMFVTGKENEYQGGFYNRTYTYNELAKVTSAIKNKIEIKRKKQKGGDIRFDEGGGVGDMKKWGVYQNEDYNILGNIFNYKHTAESWAKSNYGKEAGFFKEILVKKDDLINIGKINKSLAELKKGGWRKQMYNVEKINKVTIEKLRLLNKINNYNSDIRFDEGGEVKSEYIKRVKEAIKYVENSPTARMQIDFEDEEGSKQAINEGKDYEKIFPLKSKSNSFIVKKIREGVQDKYDSIGIWNENKKYNDYKYPKNKKYGDKSKEFDTLQIANYDEKGKIVGILKIATSENKKEDVKKGSFKISVRQDYQNKGIASKLIEKAESEGIDFVEALKNNNFTSKGRWYFKSWLNKKLKNKEKYKYLDGGMVIPKELYHYTSEINFDRIFDSNILNPSQKYGNRLSFTSDSEYHKKEHGLDYGNTNVRITFDNEKLISDGYSFSPFDHSLKQNKIGKEFEYVISTPIENVKKYIKNITIFEGNAILGYIDKTATDYVNKYYLNSDIRFKEGGMPKKETFNSIGSAIGFGTIPMIEGHDMVAECDCGEKFTYQNSKKDTLWQCPKCNVKKGF